MCICMLSCFLMLAMLATDNSEFVPLFNIGCRNMFWHFNIPKFSLNLALFPSLPLVFESGCFREASPYALAGLIPLCLMFAYIRRPLSMTP